MLVDFLDLKRQYINLKDEIDRVVIKVLSDGHYILGNNVADFERAFAEYCGSKYAVGVGSGADALFLSLVSCNVKSGDEVVTVSNTALATVNAISRTGATPVFADVDSRTLTMDPDDLQRKITSRTKAVVPVHLYGRPCDMDRLTRISNAGNISIIEDACQSHGAKYNGRKAGTMGELGCFSFYPTKNLGGYGDGGMILTDSKTKYEELLKLRYYGMGKEGKGELPGMNSRLDEVQAAILLVKLGYLDAWNDKRRALSEYYIEHLRELPVALPILDEGDGNVFHLFVMRTKRRDELKNCLASCGIGTLVHYPVNIHLHPVYSYLGMQKGFLPISETASEEILSLPLYPEIGLDEMDCVIKKIRDFFSGSTA